MYQARELNLQQLKRNILLLFLVHTVRILYNLHSSYRRYLSVEKTLSIINLTLVPFFWKNTQYTISEYPNQCLANIEEGREAHVNVSRPRKSPKF
jgi:hypothetical protein